MGSQARPWILCALKCICTEHALSLSLLPSAAFAASMPSAHPFWTVLVQHDAPGLLSPFCPTSISAEAMFLLTRGSPMWPCVFTGSTGGAAHAFPGEVDLRLWPLLSHTGGCCSDWLSFQGGCFQGTHMHMHTCAHM